MPVTVSAWTPPDCSCLKNHTHTHTLISMWGLCLLAVPGSSRPSPFLACNSVASSPSYRPLNFAGEVSLVQNVRYVRSMVHYFNDPKGDPGTLILFFKKAMIAVVSSLQDD